MSEDSHLFRCDTYIQAGTLYGSGLFKLCSAPHSFLNSQYPTQMISLVLLYLTIIKSHFSNMPSGIICQNPFLFANSTSLLTDLHICGILPFFTVLQTSNLYITSSMLILMQEPSATPFVSSGHISLY